jgi:hypothetical protein
MRQERAEKDRIYKRLDQEKAGNGERDGNKGEQAEDGDDGPYEHGECA